MVQKDITGPVFRAKVMILVVGVAVLTLGLYSHFQSTWVKLIPVGYAFLIPAYQLCDVNNNENSPTCPSIALEHYFVAMIIICFVLSLVSLITGLVANLESPPLKWVDFCFHIISAGMLAVAGGLYIISAIQISKYFWPDGQPEDMEGLEYIQLRKWEKIAAGALTIAQALIYGVVSLLIYKS